MSASCGRLCRESSATMSETTSALARPARTVADRSRHGSRAQVPEGGLMTKHVPDVRASPQRDAVSATRRREQQIGEVAKTGIHVAIWRHRHPHDSRRRVPRRPTWTRTGTDDRRREPANSRTALSPDWQAAQTAARGRSRPGSTGNRPGPPRRDSKIHGCHDTPGGTAARVELLTPGKKQRVRRDHL